MKLRYVIFLYFLALLSMGVFHIAITPIFEPFDEKAHYSYIRQIAYQSKIPMRGEYVLDQVVTNYQGPYPYGSGNPPFDSGMVYYKFFNRQDLTDSYVMKNRHNALPSSFVPSQQPNWESQHPPLYYALMSPILKLVGQEALVTQIFVLRLLSYLLALAGVALGILAIAHKCRVGEPTQYLPLLIGFLIYPFMLPMFFPEFARIGNDSLCLFLVGLLAYWLSKWLANGGELKTSLAIGITLGLGLLTKAFFIPIAAAIGMFIVIHFLTDSGTDKSAGKLASRILFIFLPAIALGGIWYVYNYFVFGDFSGSVVGIELAHKGGLLANIVNTFSLPIFLRGIATTPVTFAWGGTLSLVHLPHVLYVPIIAAITWVSIAFCIKLRNIPYSNTLWLTSWLIFFFGVGISWHAIVNIALEGNANTPGWYLHILLPFLAPAIGVGVLAIWRNSKSKFLFLSLLLYCIVFYLVAIWSQIALFTGCAIKGDDKQFVFQTNLMCLDNIPQVIDRLNILGYPHVGGIGFVVWVVCSVLLIIELRKMQ